MKNDLKFALRGLAKSPGFTLVAILSLALGIGANATVLTWIENLVMRPLPGVARQEDLVIITTSQSGRMWDTVSLPDIRDIATQSDIFAGVCGSQQTPASFTADDRNEWLYGQIVTANFFNVLGVAPILGRTFQPEEDLKPGGHPVLVISEKLWRRRFAGSPTVIGKFVDLNRHGFTIIGVVPAAFQGDIAALQCDFWAPAMMHREVAYSGLDPNAILQRYSRWHHTYARLQPGVSVARARAALDALSVRLEQTYPDTNRDIRLHAWPLWQATYGAQKIFRPVFGLLLAASLGVLLIVTANLASLLLARAAARRREIAIRLAVGASRLRLIRQLLTESLLLAVAGGLAGLLLARWLVSLVGFFTPPTPHLPINIALEVSWRTLGLTLLLTLAAGAIFGLAPALQSLRARLTDALKDGGRTAGSGSHQRARSLLVVAEVALAVALLIGAGLCFQGLRQARQVDPGLDPRGVLLASLRIGMNGYNRDTAPEFYRQLRQRIAVLPGVDSVALANWFPLGFEDTGTGNIEIPGRPTRTGELLNFRLAVISPDYFRTLGIPVVAGRDFNERDNPTAPRAVIVNETFAQRFWPGQEAVGRTIKIDGRERTIVGVVKAGKYRALNDPPECFYYLPNDQARWALDLGLCIRSATGAADNPQVLTRLVQREIHALDPNVTIWATLPLENYVQAAAMTQRIASTLLAVLSAVALLLAAMGVYAVMAYAVSQRTQEFGVRMALGANARQLHWQVVRRGLVLAATGAGVGLLLAFAVSRLLTNFLYGVSPFDPVTFTGVPLLLAAIAILACWLPARRATKVDPMTALRAE
ncbi:MAG TPA: ABC transporter permease [Lacunisphaera sp.]|nr:ABC transporter permease [Lacunisphaera sp.]